MFEFRKHQSKTKGVGQECPTHNPLCEDLSSRPELGVLQARRKVRRPMQVHPTLRFIRSPNHAVFASLMIAGFITNSMFIGHIRRYGQFC